MTSRARKTSAALLLSLTVFVSGFGVFAPRPTYAQLAVTDPVVGTNTTINNVEDFMDKVLLGGVTMSFINSLNYFTQKIAYDAAVYIAAGGKGEGPLFQYKDFGSYLGDVALGAAGEAIGTFSEIGFLGFNLCEPSGPDAPRISLALQLGIASQYEAPAPKCEWSKIAASWDQFSTSFETGEVLRNIQLSIGPGQTGLHGLFQAPLKVEEKISSDKVAAEQDRTEGQGFKSLTDVVTGRQKTPAAVIKDTALENTSKKPAQEAQTTASIIGPVLSKGVVQVLSVALGTFVNTLASQLLKQVFEQGIDVTGFDMACAFRDAVPGSADALSGLNCPPDPSDAEGAARGGRAAAQAAYSSLLAPRVQEVNNFDAVAEFTVCPDAFRGPQNCAMDSGFAAGVRVAIQGEAITIRDAFDQGYLHADWPLVPPTGDGASRNADPFCFNTGYCYSNLVKLRKARIIPIGFELAAEKALPDTTLGKVVAAFHDCSGPNGQFCNLIDPDWLLKYPLTQCRAKVFGPTLLAGDTDIRGETCVDAPTCIAENADGTCGAGYGYCTREKNIWRLGGDVCPVQYASCQAYAGPNNRNLSVLNNTVDKGICSFENAGCNWYATKQDPGNGLGDWQYQTGRLFLDREAGTCTEENAGCSEFIVHSGVKANLVRNPSFELNNQTATRPDFWENAPTTYPRDISAADGNAAVSSAAGITQRIGVDQGEAYALSAAARSATGAAGGRVQLVVGITDAAGADVGFAMGDSTCTLSGASGTVLTLNVTPHSDVDFVRDNCAFTVPFGGEVLTLRVVTEGGALADAIQLEYGASSTAFRSNAYQDEQRITMKQPPAWLGCTGENSDPPECEKYAGVCRPDEVGCDAYTPKTGGVAVPGIVSQENRCDAACSGYATYKEEASTLSYARYPVHLIPSRGRTCSLAAAGCTEFTNLDTAAAGGEAREYYATLRICEKPRSGELVPVYYTWEGSDTTGFQLKEWRVKAETAAVPGGGRPPMLIRGTNPASCTSAIYLAGSNPDCREFFDVAGNISYRLYSKTIVISPDCRPLRMTELPVDESATAGTCGTRGGRFVDGKCSVCEGFGGTWNTPGGADLGCTFNAFAPESRSCTAAESSCRLYTGNAGANIRREGFWDFEGGDREGWGPDATTAVSTESTAVGGHSIRIAAGGTLSHPAPAATANNTYYLTFWGKGRGAITARFSDAPPDRAFTTGGVTLGSTWNRYTLGPVLVDWTPAADQTLVFSGFSDISFIDRIEGSRVASNIGLVKDSWTIPAVCDQNASGAFLPQAQLGCTEYRAQRSGNTEYLTSFSSLCREKAVGCSAFIATQQSPSPGRESWNALCVLPTNVAAATPCSIDGREVCTVGVNRRSCRYQADDLPSPVSFEVSVAGVCQVDGIVITESNGTPVRRGTPGTCTGQPQDLVVVPADTNVYLVDDAAMRCEPEFAGCTLTGRSDGRVCTMPDGRDAGSDPDACVPGSGSDVCDCKIDGEPVCQVKAGETACRAPLPFREPFSSTVRINYAETPVLNDPKQYGQSLCSIEAVGCQEWTEVGPTTGKAYFKDPETRTCEYRENVPDGSGRTLSGWYRTGTSIACDPALLVSGETYGIWKNGDEQYQGFAGQCPSNVSTCSEFLDPADRDTRHPLGQPYYFLKNNKIDTTSCRGQVNPLNGCVLFNDTTNPIVTANTLVTNNVSVARGNASVPPVSCPGEGCNQCVYEKYFNRHRVAVMGPGGVSAEHDAWDSATMRTDNHLCSDASDCTGVRDGETAGCSGVTARIAEPWWTTMSFPDQPVRFVDAYGSVQPTYNAFVGTFVIKANDANTVINVTRDRVCGEWLACQSSSPVWDPSRNRFIEICDAIGRCNEFQKNGDSTQCVSWVSREPKILTKDTYTARNTSYAGLDYSGYSIPHLFDVESLRQIPVGRFCTGNPNLSCTSNTNCAAADAGTCNPTPEFRLARVISTCPITAADGSTCTSADFPERGQGRCWQGTCAQAPNGSPVETATLRRDEPQPMTAFGTNQNAESPACRAYPERNSPFPPSVVTKWDPIASNVATMTRALPQSTQPGFNRATVCEKGQDCECTYQKIEYQGGQTTVYLNVDEGTSFTGICVGGPKEKQPCNPTDSVATDQCGTGGTCQKISRKNIVQGLNGYCLERDQGFSINGKQSSSFEEPGRACVTWLPVDRLSGAIDVYNNYGNAGFNIENAAYCAAPEAYKEVRPYAGNRPKPVTVTYGSAGSFDMSVGCAEYDNGTEENYPYYDNGTKALDLEDNTASEAPDFECPGNTGFIVINSNRDNAAGPFDCTQGVGSDNDYAYFCVPKNSHHMADPGKSLCMPPGSTGSRGISHAQRRDQASGFGTQHAQFYVTGMQLETNVTGLERPAGSPAPDTTTYSASSPIAYYADCVATDTLIPGGPISPGKVFFGCKDVVEVSVGSRPGKNKAFTGRMGNGRTPPPDSTALVDAPGVVAPQLRYAWTQDSPDIEPYGRASVPVNIDTFTRESGDLSPVEIRTCKSGAAYGLPNELNTCTVGDASHVSEARPYALITAGTTGTSCTPGAAGDIGCSRPATPSCSKTSGTIQGCFKRCTTNADCGATLGTCQENAGLGIKLCSSGLSGDWSTDISSCESDSSRILVGSCVTAGSRTGNNCGVDRDCAAVRCLAVGAGAGICEGTGIAPGAPAANCDANGTCRSYDVDRDGTAAAGPSFPNIIARLKQIFAATYNLFVYHPTDGSPSTAAVPNPDYVPASTASPLVYDISDTIGAPPVVRAVGDCTTENQCLEGLEGQVSVNGVENGDVTGGNGNKNITLRFFAYAQNDQMPLRNVIVDWGDGGPTPDLSGDNPGSSYKNRRGYVYRHALSTDSTSTIQLVSLCDSHEFGTSPDACDSLAPMSFNHSYICNREATARCFDGTNNCVRTVDGRDACVYKPKVQVQDNWGFCNGTCPGGPAGGSCYDAMTNPTLMGGTDATMKTNECEPDAFGIALGLNPYTLFAGTVVVFPRE